ncbi:ATP-binding protein [Streptomyces sp. NPDC001549]|uniref:ATP-binding protein n=1 Tax=Streptomyces sp. NPDC001549 TaxID=3364586 RepID=UPI0036D1FB8E
MEIPSDMRAAGAARRFAAAKLYEWGCADLEDDAVLICSELATNAAVHGRAQTEGHNEHIRLDLTWRPGNALIIQVEDNSSAQPTPRDSAPSAESGRGLGLVASLADQWSCWLNRDGRGKRVQVCLRPPPPSMAG